MDEEALKQEMATLNVQSIQLKQSIEEAQEGEKVASDKAKPSEKDYDDSTAEEKESLAKAQEEADKKLRKATITYEKATAKLKAAKDEAQLLPLRTASFEKRTSCSP
ncbi:hypothetical protein PR003_g13561 [Phytophthora rubi]|uniref:Uncharacterized protein n=1 Tax=Phytophthora rubi TaxID=129364 RepID=A0A6A3LKQ7_9STRA|nr:hypothetical protein PR002_g13000 [Phytophthora rubi]KAE9023902.1 hypothetical protein PR001_g12803 [Phytophthora rubi]KAE9334362.1 hypothetical protein PR003_g13561 [Phytophthora rubi]